MTIISSAMTVLMAVSCGVLDAGTEGSAVGTTEVADTTTPTQPESATTGVDSTGVDSTAETGSTASSGGESTASTTANGGAEQPAEIPQPTFESLDGLTTIGTFAGSLDAGIGRWQDSVDGIETIDLTSTADGASQPALWLAPTSDGPAPLIVILHSWSSNYDQHAGIPYAMWAAENGWAAIAPQFRGVNDNPEALGSDLAVQDVADAIDFAVSQDGVDARRVYAVGYSGGGMMALLMAGRHPDLIGGAAAWGPPSDLLAFYDYSARRGSDYANQIASGCGGDPTSDDSARAECVDRSALTYLEAAREAGVPVFIGQGIQDTLVQPSQSARSFNALVAAEARLEEADVATLGGGAVPDGSGDAVAAETYFADDDPTPVFARSSDAATVIFFDAGHDMVYGASARWIASLLG